MKKNIFRHGIAMVGLLAASVGAICIADNFYVYSGGTVAFTAPSESIGRVGISADKTTATVYDKDGKELISAPLNMIDSVTFDVPQVEKPVADILDVQFNADGTATDVSPMHNNVETKASGALTTYFSNTYGRYVAKFANTWAGSTSGYYKIDYSSNQAFKDALADGHTLEAVVMADYNPPIKEGEAKFFSSHETGGTGLYVCKSAKGKNGKNELCFLPHVGGAWRHASSGIVPEPGKYYHVVGVWNKEEGKDYIYINGELMTTADAAGEFQFPKDNSNWFAVGCDAGPSGQLGWSGDVVLARIYDDPLTQDEVALLWNEIDEMQQASQPDLVTDVEFTSGLPVKVGQTFVINGKGFEAGDQINFVPISEGETVVADGTATADGFSIVIPADMKDGQYRLVVVRGDNTQDLGLIKMTVVETFPPAPVVVAHRGYWDTEGAAQNSRASLRNSQELGVYGSETDVWLTTDGHLVINHNAAINGVTIQNSTYDQVKDMTLSNGEKLPQLQEFLTMLQDKSKTTKLFIEVKTHDSYEKNMAVTHAIVDAVKEYGVEDRVQYIAFSLDVCRELAKLVPPTEVAYLSSDRSPRELYDNGVKGMQYTQATYRANPTWMSEAHQLGMVVNVQGCNTAADMADMIGMGADIISTDKPVLGMEVRQYYLDNQD